MSDNRPLVTFALFAYNQERFIAEAVRGALNQTYSLLEIIISDDCSIDRTFEIIKEEVAAYSGPHEIRLNRNDTNIGWGAHINRVMEMVSGRLIVVAAGDDVSLPDRVEAIYQSYSAAGGRALSLYSNAIVIDENGREEGLYLPPVKPGDLSLTFLAERFGGVLGCAHAWDRRVFDLFGPIVDSKVVTEDIIIPFRSALIGEIAFVDRPLVLYRRHDNNIHFKDPGEVETYELEKYLLKHADTKIEACKNRLKDLSTIYNLFPERQSELIGVRKKVLSNLHEFEVHKLLLSTSGNFKRAVIMWRAMLRGVRARVIIRWVLTFFFPSLYLSYQNYLRAKVRQKPLTAK